jgi:hypothetical protein
VKKAAASYIKEWVVVDNGASKSYPLILSDNAYDTNGLNNKPVRYYINEGSAFDSTSPSALKTTDGDTMWYLRGSDINDVVEVQFRALDDDGNLAGGTYWVYADSAPPRPELLLPANASTVSGNVNFKWHIHDRHDKASTKFKLMYYKGTNAPAAVNGMDFTVGTSLGFNASDSTFTLTGTGLPTGTINWFILAKDQQESQTISDTLWFDH